MNAVVLHKSLPRKRGFERIGAPPCSSDCEQTFGGLHGNPGTKVPPIDYAAHNSRKGRSYAFHIAVAYRGAHPDHPAPGLLHASLLIKSGEFRWIHSIG